MVVLVVASPPLICIPKENGIVIFDTLGSDDEVIQEDAVNNDKRIGSVLFSGIADYQIRIVEYGDLKLVIVEWVLIAFFLLESRQVSFLSSITSRGVILSYMYFAVSWCIATRSIYAWP